MDEDLESLLEDMLPTRPIVFETFSVDENSFLLIHMQNHPNPDANLRARMEYLIDFISGWGDIVLWVNPDPQLVMWIAMNGREFHTSYADPLSQVGQQMFMNLKVRGLI